MSGDVTYDFTVQITKTQWGLRQFFAVFTSRLRWFAWIVVTGVFYAVIDSSIAEDEMTPIAILGRAAALATALWILHGLSAAIRTLFYDPRAFRPMQYSINENGVRVAAEHAQADLAWPYLTDVKTGRRHCMLYLDKKNAYTIPRSSFPPELDWETFCADCSGWFQLAKAHAEQ